MSLFADISIKLMKCMSTLLSYIKVIVYKYKTNEMHVYVIKLY